MEIIEKNIDGKTLRIKVSTNEESLFSILKTYLLEMKEVDIAGFLKDHYLLDETEFFLKVKSGDPEEVFKKGLKEAKKKLGGLKI